MPCLVQNSSALAGGENDGALDGRGLPNRGSGVRMRHSEPLTAASGLGAAGRGYAKLRRLSDGSRLLRTRGFTGGDASGPPANDSGTVSRAVAALSHAPGDAWRAPSVSDTGSLREPSRAAHRVRRPLLFLADGDVARMQMDRSTAFQLTMSSRHGPHFCRGPKTP